MKTITLLSAINNNIKYILTPYNKWKHLETYFTPKNPKAFMCIETNMSKNIAYGNIKMSN
jgi:hypothetical protein